MNTGYILCTIFVALCVASLLVFICCTWLDAHDKWDGGNDK